jgi:hypothetical protein
MERRSTLPLLKYRTLESVLKLVVLPLQQSEPKEEEGIYIVYYLTTLFTKASGFAIY